MIDYRQREQEMRAKAARSIEHIQDQIEKRQYLNASYEAADLARTLISALSCVLKTTTR